MGEKLVNSTDRVEDRVEVDPNSKVEIPEELHEDLHLLQSALTDLEKGRKELGRLMQVVNNITNFCHDTEKRSKTLRKSLSEKVGLSTEGRWVIDFTEKVFYRVAPGMPNVV